MGCQVVLGRTGDDLCPVSALLEYLARRGGRPGALSQWQNGTALSKTWFVEVVRQALTVPHLPIKDYATHTLRLGATTATAMARLEDSTFQILGQWRSDSYQLYIRMAPPHLVSLSSSLS